MPAVTSSPEPRRPPRKLATHLLAAGAIALLRPATSLLRRRAALPDGMRRRAAVNLRGEAAKFVLSAMALNHPADLAAMLQHVLRGEPGLRWVLAPSRHRARPRPDRHADVVTAGFAIDGALQSLATLLDGDHDESLLPAVTAALIRAYNRSRHEGDTERPERIWYDWSLASEHDAPWPAASHARADALARRILSATWLSYDESPQRFDSPDFYRRKHGGLGSVNIVARPQPEGSVDLWVQFQHAVIDGLPAQEALARLSAAWGRRGPLTFPPAGRTSAPILSGRAHGRAVERRQCFVDFAPLLALRKALDAKLDIAVTGRVHLSALLLWCLAHQPEFTGHRFCLAIDVPAFAFLVIRPADFFDGPAGPRLSAFVREFNRLLTLTRHRRSPPDYAIQHNSGSGTFGVSLIGDAEIFLAPVADRGFDDGSLAIGSMDLPTADGSRVGSASFAAPLGRTDPYPAALRRAVENCSALVPS